jgi:hypothetical protein
VQMSDNSKCAETNRPALTFEFNKKESWRILFCGIVEPFIVGVEGRYDEVDDGQLTHGPMSAAGRDLNGRQRLYRKEHSIQFDLANTLQDHIYLGLVFMVMSSGVFSDFNKVDARRTCSQVAKGPPGLPTGTIQGWNFVELCDSIWCHRTILPYLSSNKRLSPLTIVRFKDWVWERLSAD